MMVVFVILLWHHFCFCHGVFVAGVFVANIIAAVLFLVVLLWRGGCSWWCHGMVVIVGHVVACLVVCYSTLVLVIALGWYQSMYGYQHYQCKKSPLQSLSSSSSTSSSVSDPNNNKSSSHGNNVHVDAYLKNR